ncbi:MAG TPA: hypothetical protein PKA64_08085, partial [Myxococcota bacterium]|nr:hypothetical protein [Myxococcota bacterium]
MAKKDILDIISRPATGGPRRGEPVPPSRTKGDSEITRVSTGVVRRRRANEAAPEPEPPSAAVVVRRRPATAEPPPRGDGARAEAAEPAGGIASYEEPFESGEAEARPDVAAFEPSAGDVAPAPEAASETRLADPPVQPAEERVAEPVVADRAANALLYDEAFRD